MKDTLVDGALADETLYLTAFGTAVALLLILGVWLIWRAAHRERYLGTRANTQLPVRHRREDVGRGTRRIDLGSVARARAMIPPEAERGDVPDTAGGTGT